MEPSFRRARGGCARGIPPDADALPGEGETGTSHRRQLVVEAAQARLLLAERLDDVRVELPPRLSLDLGDRLVPGEGRPVRTIARHRVERVGDREHARPERDLR